MKKMKKIAIVLVIIAVVSLGTVWSFAKVAGDPTGLDAVFAQDGGKEGHGFIMKRILDRIADKLNLTEDQKTQIRQTLENEFPVVQPLLAQARATNLKIMVLGKDGFFNKSHV